MALTYQEYQGDEEKQKESGKKKWILLVLILFLVLGIAGGGVAAALLLSPKPVATIVRVTFDPTVVSGENDERHINGAENFYIDLLEGSKENSQYVNESLNQGEYMRFSYRITNEGPQTVKWTLNLQDLANSGFKIQYQMANSGNRTDFNEGDVISSSSGLAPDATDELWVFFLVEETFNPSISGAVVLTISVA